MAWSKEPRFSYVMWLAWFHGEEAARSRVMLWTMFFFSGKSWVHATYLNIVKDHVHPLMTTVFPNNSDQNNVPCTVVKKYQMSWGPWQRVYFMTEFPRFQSDQVCVCVICGVINLSKTQIRWPTRQKKSHCFDSEIQTYLNNLASVSSLSCHYLYCTVQQNVTVCVTAKK